jgi:4-amino-4-deoxy-L-arabinose transferase-like glycosyltransferase
MVPLHARALAPNLAPRLRRRWDYVLVGGACLVPRLIAMLHEGAALLPLTGGSVEKSDLIARVFLKSGTFGFVPGEPTAYTQPVYAWFMIDVYWLAGRHWWSLGTAQIAVAVLTAVLVYEIGRRFLSRRAGVIAALISTLQPYLIWHDVHANREIVDQPLGAAVFLLVLLAAKRSSLRLSIALGIVTGVAMLSNSRLVALPIAFAAYLLWRRVGWAAAIAVVVLAGVTISPWVVRNKVEVGCWALTDDGRALWKANNPNTYRILAAGGWIDSVPNIAGRPPGPQDAYYDYTENGIDDYKTKGTNECAAEAFYEHLVVKFVEHHPGTKVKLMVQATKMLWSPSVTADAGESSSTGGIGSIKHIVEPAYVIAMYLLALVGLFVVERAFAVLALTFLGYETLAAWVFAGTTRYRVPWDFVLALLASAALTRWPLPLPWRKRSPSQ